MITNQINLTQLRTSYEQAQLLEASLAATPMLQLNDWLNQAIAAKIAEPNAMTLATVGQDLAGIWRPSTRIVLVKHLDEAGLTWFTNYESRKGQELAAHPYASLQFHWVSLERQVRLEGMVEPLTDLENDEYFHSRPLGSQIGACASPQSQIIANRLELEERTAQLLHAHEQTGVLPQRPKHWGGYRLRPDTVEFWQGRPNRLHDRLRYRRLQQTWCIERLAP